MPAACGTFAACTTAAIASSTVNPLSSTVAPASSTYAIASSTFVPGSSTAAIASSTVNPLSSTVAPALPSFYPVYSNDGSSESIIFNRLLSNSRIQFLCKWYFGFVLRRGGESRLGENRLRMQLCWSG